MADFITTVHNLVTEGQDYTMRQIAVLAAVAAEQNRSVKHLAGELKLSKPAITRACDKLSADGLVARAVSSEDRRQVRISLTKKGAEFAERLQSGFEPIPVKKKRAA